MMETLITKLPWVGEETDKYLNIGNYTVLKITQIAIANHKRKSKLFAEVGGSERQKF